MSWKLWYVLVGLGILAIGIFVGSAIQKPTDDIIIDTTQEIDYSSRFDRLDTAMINHTVDICFQWGGQWVTDENNLLEQEFDIPLADGSFRKGKVVLCVKQKQEVQQ